MNFRLARTIFRTESGTKPMLLLATPTAIHGASLGRVAPAAGIAVGGVHESSHSHHIGM